MITDSLNCPACEKNLEPGFLYVRGIGSALFWSQHGDTGMMSRKNLSRSGSTKSARPAPAPRR